MTKAQAIKGLERLGWKVIDARKGRSSVELEPPVCATYPEGWTAWATKTRVVSGDPKDLLAELMEGQ